MEYIFNLRLLINYVIALSNIRGKWYHAWDESFQRTLRILEATSSYPKLSPIIDPFNLVTSEDSELEQNQCRVDFVEVLPLLSCGRGSRVVKVSDRGLLCHGPHGGCGSSVVKVSDHGRHVMSLSSSPVPLKARRVGVRCTLNMSRAQTSSRWGGVVVRRGGASSGVVLIT
ncbi:hypothetical protein TNCV_42381 [Trichonephila clavipes]|nr:hypothetical protein TNCV_42381 [Trichonephila clavipes]